MGNCFVNCCCCQHNCLIFPAPRAIKGWQFQTQTIQSEKTGGYQIKVQLKKFINQAQQQVPYMEISSEKSRNKKQLIIYFHGNAQDIFHAIDFILPIFKSTEITILCLQYPTYSCYKTQKRYFISDRIKINSVQFHNYVQNNYNLKSQQIHIIGRSIGTGPASYLASQVNCSKLVLISPFDSIRKVSMGLVGCIGFMVKNHFSNEESILTHNGDLLVIHGMIDEVINFNHGRALVTVYQSKQKKKCTFIQPPRMSHNLFDLNQDIVKPIQQFLTNNQGKTLENH